tara:strand:- start:117 stop:1295 length:1179 start_codon:yes stop_codon:yes gene_type:complete
LIRTACRYILIILLSTLSSLYLFEYFLVYSAKNIEQNKAKIFEEENGKKYESRSKIVVFNELKKKNPKLTSTLVPKHFAISSKQKVIPLGGLSKSKTLHCNENGYFSIFESDRYGFNNPDNEWDNEEIEFFLVGDSFTIGECVNRPYDFGSVLRKLSKKSVLNLGYSSNGPMLQFAALKEYLDENVNNILWFYFEDNDLQDLNDTMNSKILNSYLDNKEFSQSLRSKQKEIDIIVDKTVKEHLKYFQSREEKKKKNQILRFIRLDKTKDKLKVLLNNNNKKEKFNEEVFLKFKKILEHSKILAEKNNTELYFIYLPSYQRFSKFGFDGDLNQRDELISMVKSLDIKIIDVFTEIEKKEIDYKSLFPFGSYGHYNIKGYDEISKIIYDKTLNK